MSHDSPTQEIQTPEAQREKLLQLVSALKDIITTLPEQIEIQTVNGPLTVDSRKSEIYSGGMADTRSRREDSPAYRYSAKVHKPDSAEQMLALSYDEAYTETTERTKGPKQIPIKTHSPTKMKLTRGNERHTLLDCDGDRITLQKGLTIENLEDILSFFKRVKAAHEDQRVEAKRKEEEVVANQLVKTRELIQALGA